MTIQRSDEVTIEFPFPRLSKESWWQTWASLDRKYWWNMAMFFYHKAWYTDKLQQMKTLHKTRGLLFWHVEHFRGMPVLTSQKLQNQVRNEKPVRYSESSCLMGPACHWSCALSGRRHSRHTHAGRCRQWMGRWLRHRGGPPLLSPAQQCCLPRGGSGKEWCFVCLYLCCGYVHREIRQKKKSKNKTKPKKPRD